SGRAAFALHLDDLWHVAPEVLLARGRPRVRHLPHRGRGRDGIDRDHLAQPVRDARRGLVAVNRDEPVHFIARASRWQMLAHRPTAESPCEGGPDGCRAEPDEVPGARRRPRGRTFRLSSLRMAGPPAPGTASALHSASAHPAPGLAPNRDSYAQSRAR